MTHVRTCPRVVIAGVSSGVGKTSITVAIARALVNRGLRVAMFKCGPDYLDPTYHARAVRGTCHNLDGWMMGRAGVLTTFAQATRAADVALIEGVMGLFDGATLTSDEGSTAEIAKWLSAPVVLVCDASGMARSVAALAHGFAGFDPKLSLAGLIANRVGGLRHLELLREALGDSLPYVAGLSRQDELAFPERHLGLCTAEHGAISERQFEAWATLAEQWLALDQLLALARRAPPLAEEGVTQVTPVGRCRIGIAQDAAFHFYYDYNLRLLEQLGAELVPFSPIHDRRLPDVDGLYIGGGYPELHVRALAENTSMLADLRAFAAKKRPIYGECGGLMYLVRSIRTLGAEAYPMVGLLPGEAVMAHQLKALGYVEVVTERDTLLGPRGTRYRGHQFRYSELTLDGPVDHAFKLVRRRDGAHLPEGYCAGSTLASYVHAHWASNPEVARAFVSACVRGPLRPK